MIGRKSDRIKAVHSREPENINQSISAQGIDLKCVNCQERYYFVELQVDPNNIFCTNCGQLTPIRQLKRLRGIKAPGIQESGASIIQSEKAKTGAGKRRPSSMINKPVDPAIESFGQSGNITIIDSQTNIIS